MILYDKLPNFQIILSNTIYLQTTARDPKTHYKDQTQKWLSSPRDKTFHDRKNLEANEKDNLSPFTTWISKCHKKLGPYHFEGCNKRSQWEDMDTVEVMHSYIFPTRTPNSSSSISTLIQ